MVLALLNEAELEKEYIQDEIIQTIYLGGGTPSLLSLSDCLMLMTSIRKHYRVAEDAEITLEANPDDIHPDLLKGWREIGINRLSIGIQSFFEDELIWMNRAHNSLQAHQSIEWSHQYGFHNISIDLIYGSPLLTDEMWLQNVTQAIAFDIPHLSCYALTVEEKTPLYKMIQKKYLHEVDNEKQARQFLLLMKWLREKGYEHYEISNFAKPGSRSRHNAAYWKGEKYLGLGPSAHSYNGKERRWNIANNLLYMKGIQTKMPNRESEILTSVQSLNEFIMISLRTREGLNLEKLEHKWGFEKKNKAIQDLQKFTDSGLVRFDKNHVHLTDNGMLRADGIASELFS